MTPGSDLFGRVGVELSLPSTALQTNSDPNRWPQGCRADLSIVLHRFIDSLKQSFKG